MFGFRYIKTGPTTYLLHYRRGRVVREGVGQSFWYFAPSSTLAVVPVSSVDLPFVFNEVTADYQTVAIQGQLTYRIADPQRTVTLLDFTIAPSGRYTSSDPESLKDRLVAAAQVMTSTVTHRLTLREALSAYESLCREVLAGLRASDNVRMMGLEILGLSILAISPTPEVARALEAEAREEMQRRSDEAVYARRNGAVEQERRIRESELNTEIAVEEKRRIKRETQMAAEIAVEQQRAQLVEKKVENDRRMADSQAYAVEAVMKSVQDVDWRKLLALNAAHVDARQSMAMAFRELAENAQKIGTLNITPDLLESLVSDAGSARERR